MTKMKMIVLAALVGSVTSAAASPQITGVGCKLEAGKLAANVTFRDASSGATYDYKATVDQRIGTTTLRDAAGRTIASARASSASPDREVTFGVGWTRTLGEMLQDVMGDSRVQDELARCSFPPDDWGPWFCPVYIFVWDEELADFLCSWMPGWPNN